MLELLRLEKTRSLSPTFNVPWLGHIALHRLQVALCSSEGIQGLLWHSCLTWAACTMGCRGIPVPALEQLLCLLHLGVCRALHSNVLTSVLVSSSSALTSLPLLNALSQRCSTTDGPLCHGSGIGSVGGGRSFWQLLTEVTLPAPHCRNLGTRTNTLRQGI